MGINVRGRILALFLYMLCLHSVAIFLFTRGFLLTRTELPSFSNCSDIAESPCFSRAEETDSSEKVYQGCSDVPKGEAICSLKDTIDKPGIIVKNSKADGVLGDRNHQLQNAKAKINGKAQGGVKQSGVGKRETDGEDGAFKEGPSGECWTKPAIKRAIIIIIDALRFDFVAPSSNFAGERQPWMDKLQVLQRLAEEEKSSARIFKFVADPPTTTLQRLKGLTTGGLPTFVDIGHSFGAPAIVEDNLISQLVRRGKKVRMMGDDTWMKLFPSHFSVAHPFDSFNVKDLHTVDDGVIREIYPALLQPDWNVLIAHFLGVDHVGHIFGVESPLMVEKLEQYNRVIEEIVAVLKKESVPGGLHEDTMLLVLGDHGQTLHGDHGGGTSEEVETALFAMGMRNPPGLLPLDLQSSTCNMNKDSRTNHSQCITTFPQLDFSATMATLLGVPFPFGSVGRVNTELYALAGATWPSANTSEDHLEKSFVRDWMEGYSDVLCINSWQVKRYLDAYSASSIRGFPAPDLSHVQSLYAKAQITFKPLHIDPPQKNLSPRDSDFSDTEESTDESITRLRERIQGYLDYLLAAADLARAQWTQFGDEWMALGLILLVISIVVHAVALTRALRLTNRGRTVVGEDYETQNKFQELFPFKQMLIGCGVAATVTAGVVKANQFIPTWMQYPALNTIFTGQSKTIIPAAVLIASVVAYVTPASIYRQVQTKKINGSKEETTDTGSQEQRSCIPNVKSYAAILFVGIHACGLMSNSYIIGEGQVVCFLLATSGILYLRLAIQTGSKVSQALLFLILNGGMASVGLVEIFKDPATVAGPALRDDYFPASYSPKLFFTLSFIALTTTVLPLSSLAWLILRHARKLFIFRSLYWAIAVSVPLAYSLLVIHWFTMDLASSVVMEISQPFKEFSRLLCPQMVYSISLTLLVFTAVVMTFSSSKTVPSSFGSRLVEGIVSMLAGLSGTIILLLGRKGPTIVLLAVLEVWCLLDLQGLGSSDQINRAVDQGVSEKEEVNRSEEDLGSHFAAAVDWNLVAVQLFFCTGHRCTFDGLHYTAAFIGFDEFYFYRQGALLAADTFGSSHILPVIGLPLLVTAVAAGASPSPRSSSVAENKFFSLEIAKAYISYGLVRSILATVTTACVALQRRHLMVWGLFAPKYVFDALGLLVIDVFIVITVSFYFSFLPRRIRQI